MTAAITPIPALDWTSPTFKDDVELMFSTRFPNLTVELQTYMAALTTIASGGSFAISYRYSVNPGAGAILSQNANQQTSSNWYIGESDSAGVSLTAILNFMVSSTSAIKSTVRVVKATDPTKFIIFAVTAQTATGSGFRTFAVTPISASSSTPFATNDLVVLYFDTVGSVGPTGPAGSIVRRTLSLVNNYSLTVDASTTDLLSDSGIATAITIFAPTYSGVGPSDGQGLVYRLKDNGTARAIAWNVIYRAGADVILPTTTVAGKWLYVGFIYNALDSKWDLASTLGNI